MNRPRDGLARLVALNPTAPQALRGVRRPEPRSAYRGGPGEAGPASFDRAISEGILSLEVRWIVPGASPVDMSEWFGPFSGPIETLRDSYLLDRRAPNLAVKIRGGRQLDVKVYGGTPEVLTVPGRARGRLEWWKKWSFPLLTVPEDRESFEWTTVQKTRRLRFFSLDGRPVQSAGVGADDGACKVELTDVTLGQDRWWSLGFEATGPPERLASALNTAGALVFDEQLPGALELNRADSTSYPEWLERQATRREARSSEALR